MTQFNTFSEIVLQYLLEREKTNSERSSQTVHDFFIDRNHLQMSRIISTLLFYKNVTGSCVCFLFLIRTEALNKSSKLNQCNVYVKMFFYQVFRLGSLFYYDFEACVTTTLLRLFHWTGII